MGAEAHDEGTDQTTMWQSIFNRDAQFREQVIKQYAVCKDLEEQINQTPADDVDTIMDLKQYWKESHLRYRNLFLQSSSAEPAVDHDVVDENRLSTAGMFGFVVVTLLAILPGLASVAWKLYSTSDAHLVLFYTGIIVLLFGWFICAFGDQKLFICISPARRHCWRSRFILAWCAIFSSLPVVYVVDDIRSGPTERLGNVIPQIYPLMIYVHLTMGAIHSVLPANPEHLRRQLRLHVALMVVRCIILACMSGLWLEGIRAAAAMTLPTTLGFHGTRCVIWARADTGGRRPR